MSKVISINTPEGKHSWALLINGCRGSQIVCFSPYARFYFNNKVALVVIYHSYISPLWRGISTTVARVPTEKKS